MLSHSVSVSVLTFEGKHVFSGYLVHVPCFWTSSSDVLFGNMMYREGETAEGHQIAVLQSGNAVIKFDKIYIYIFLQLA